MTCPECGTVDDDHHVQVEDCDPLDDVQGHHDWDYDTPPRLGVCRRCGTLGQAWEE